MVSPYKKNTTWNQIEDDQKKFSVIKGRQGPIPKNFIFVSYGHVVFGQGLVCWNNNLTKIEKSVFIIASVILEMEMIVNWAFETR